MQVRINTKWQLGAWQPSEQPPSCMPYSAVMWTTYVNITCVCTCICSFHASWLLSVDETCHYTVTLQTPSEANDMPYILCIQTLAMMLGVYWPTLNSLFITHMLFHGITVPLTLSCTPSSEVTWSTLHRLAPSGHCTEGRE